MSRRPVVLIPGWATDRRIFSKMEPASGYIIPSEIDPDKMVPEIISLLDKKGIHKAPVVGWSLGGNIAAELASKYPGRVESLVLVSVRSSYKKDAIEKIKDTISGSRKAYLYKFYLECFSGEEKEELKWFKEELMKDYFNLFPEDILIKGLDWLWQRPIFPEKVSGFDVSFIFGKLDRIVPVEEVLRLKNMFRTSEFFFCEEAGHMPFLKDKGTLIRTRLDDYKTS